MVKIDCLKTKQMKCNKNELISVLSTVFYNLSTESLPDTAIYRTIFHDFSSKHEIKLICQIIVSWMNICHFNLTNLLILLKSGNQIFFYLSEYVQKEFDVAKCSVKVFIFKALHNNNLHNQ